MLLACIEKTGRCHSLTTSDVERSYTSGGLSARAIIGVLAVEGPSATRQEIASLADSRSARARLQVASMSARLLQIEPFRLLARNETAQNETAQHETKRNGTETILNFFERRCAQFPFGSWQKITKPNGSVLNVIGTVFLTHTVYTCTHVYYNVHVHCTCINYNACTYIGNMNHTAVSGLQSMSGMNWQQRVGFTSEHTMRSCITLGWSNLLHSLSSPGLYAVCRGYVSIHVHPYMYMYMYMQCTCTCICSVHVHVYAVYINTLCTFTLYTCAYFLHIKIKTYTAPVLHGALRDLRV